MIGLDLVETGELRAFRKMLDAMAQLIGGGVVGLEIEKTFEIGHDPSFTHRAVGGHFLGFVGVVVVVGRTNGAGRVVVVVAVLPGSLFVVEGSVPLPVLVRKPPPLRRP